MTGRELAAALLALPNPDLQVEVESDYGPEEVLGVFVAPAGVIHPEDVHSDPRRFAINFDSSSDNGGRGPTRRAE